METSQQQQQELLAKQSNIQFQIDALMRQTMAQRNCGIGTDCQRAEKEQQLRQAYEAAEVTALSAPAQLEESRRKYLRYKEGPARYDAMREDELKKEASATASKLKSALESEWKVADTFAAYYHAALTQLQHSADLARKYGREVEALRVRKQKQVSEILTNDRKTYYEQEATDTLHKWYQLWWWLYYGVLVALTLRLFWSDGGGSLLAKAVKVGIMVVYPWFIHPVVVCVAAWVQWLVSFWPKNVYNSL